MKSLRTTLQTILLGGCIAAGIGAAGFGLYKILPENVVIRGEPVKYLTTIDTWGRNELRLILQIEEKKLVPVHVTSTDQNIWYAQTLLDLELLHKESHKDKEHDVEIIGSWYDKQFYMSGLKVHHAEVRF